MKNPLLLLALTALLWAGCGSVPLTGRRQLLLVSDQEVLSSSLTQYNDYMKTAPRSSSAKQAAMVKRVGQKIAQATEAYLRQNGLASEVKNFQWEFNLVADKQVNAFCMPGGKIVVYEGLMVNAFCMPGGKIVVYEGLMKLVTSDDELAVVVGHEVAHAVAKHSNERLSQQMLAQTGAQLLNYSLAEKSAAIQAAIQTAASTIYGLGAQVGVMLPFSRKHETEADYMGLVLMRMAGYNPDVAVGFWQKMSASGSGSVPELLSTHPSDARRISDIQLLSTHPSDARRISDIRKALPEIKAKY